jgi:hypothetical protein
MPGPLSGALRLLSAAAALLAAAGAAAAPEPAAFDWRPLSALPAQVRAGLPPISADGPEERAGMRAAVVEAGTGVTAVFVRTPSRGNCGDFFFAAWRLDRGRVLGGLALDVCAGDMLLGPPRGAAVRELYVPSGDLVVVIHSWDGGAWRPSRFEEAPPDGRGGVGWAGLMALAGTTDVRAALGGAEVGAALKAALGQRWFSLLANLGVRGPMEAVDGCLAVSGNRPHSGGSEEAAAMLCPARREAHAAVLSGARVYVGSSGGRSGPLPQWLDDWVEDRRADPDPSRPPRRVVDLRRD